MWFVSVTQLLAPLKVDVIFDPCLYPQHMQHGSLQVMNTCFISVDKDMCSCLEAMEVQELLADT